MLEQWVAADRALFKLAERFSSFDPDAKLLKVVALNALDLTPENGSNSNRLVQYWIDDSCRGWAGHPKKQRGRTSCPRGHRHPAGLGQGGGQRLTG